MVEVKKLIRVHTKTLMDDFGITPEEIKGDLSNHSVTYKLCLKCGLHREDYICTYILDAPNIAEFYFIPKGDNVNE